MGLSLQALVRTVRRWWILLLLVPIGTGMIAYGVGLSRTPMYASTATLLVSISSSASLDGYNANLLAQDLSTTYQTLVETDPVLHAVATSVTPPTSAEELRKNTAVNASSGALFTITVVDPDPGRATVLVNAITVEFTQFVKGLSRADNGEYPGTVTTVVRGAEPKDPYAPRLPAYLALGVISGILLSNVGIVLFERLDTRVRPTTDLPALTGLPQLAQLPAMRHWRSSPAPIFLDDPEVSQASESIRTLRNAILATPHATGSVLAISSPNRGDGKTLVAANLAAAIARAGKLVLLVDANLREPRLHTMFQLDNATGLGTLLAAPDLSWKTGAIRVAPNLAVMPAGSTSAHPSDLLMSPTFGDLLDQVLTLADMVILDTPATSEANDAIAAATHATNVVLVCRSAKTSIHDLCNARDCFEDAGPSVLGLVVNQGGGHRPPPKPRRLHFRDRSAREKRWPNHALADAGLQPKAMPATNAG